MNVHARINEFEDALAQSLERGEFQIITKDNVRYLEPIVDEFAYQAMGGILPKIDIRAVAEDLERILS